MMTRNKGGGPWGGSDGGGFPPRHEPEVIARNHARADEVSKQADGWVLPIVRGIVAVFLLGLLLGSCVAGVMVPIRGVQWLFGS